MTFDEILEQVIALLKRQGRVSYPALKRRFALDDTYIEDLKTEILYVYPVIDDDGKGLIWTGEAERQPVSISPHLAHQIALLTTLPETPAHTQQALALHIALGAALQMAKGFGAPEVERAYARARELCQQVGETPEIVPVLYGLYRFYLGRLQLHTVREIGETLLRLAQRAHDPALAVIAHYALGTAWFCLGVLPAARQHLEEGIARYTPDQRRAPAFRMGQDPGVTCRVYA